MHTHYMPPLPHSQYSTHSDHAPLARATLYGRRASLALSFSAAAFTARMFIGTSSRIRHSSCGAAGAVGQ